MDSLDGHRRAVRLAAVGGAEVAQVLAEQLDQVGNDIAAVERVLRLARAELDRTVRRPLAAVYAETADDLAALVVERGEGFAASEVSVALRERPTFVRRARPGGRRGPRVRARPQRTCDCRPSRPTEEKRETSRDREDSACAPGCCVAAGRPVRQSQQSDALSLALRVRRSLSRPRRLAHHARHGVQRPAGTCGARGRRPRAPGRDREHRRYLRQAALESSSLDTKDKAFSDDFFAGLTSAQTGDDEAAIPLLEKVV
jgi:hypothetical protein